MTTTKSRNQNFIQKNQYFQLKLEFEFENKFYLIVIFLQNSTLQCILTLYLVFKPKLLYKQTRFNFSTRFYKFDLYISTTNLTFDKLKKEVFLLKYKRLNFIIFDSKIFKKFQICKYKSLFLSIHLASLGSGTKEKFQFTTLLYSILLLK